MKLQDGYENKLINNNFVLALFHDLVIGGIATYYLRLFRWASAQELKPHLLLSKGCKIEDSILKSMVELDVNIVYIDLHLGKFTKKSQWIPTEKNYFLTSEFQCFCYLSYFLTKQDFSSFLALYVLHPESTRVAESTTINYPFSKWYLSNGIQSTIFMDRECADSYRSFYKLKPTQSNKSSYIPIGIDFIRNEASGERYIGHNKGKNFHILTISRLDFPFKGYILGLLSDLQQLYKELPSITLTIIGDGPNRINVLQQIQKLDPKLQQHITLIENVPYENLDEYYRQCDLYIGMGTTVLDAAKYKKPSIVATAFQCENKCVGLITDNCLNVGGNLAYCDYPSTFYSQISRVCKLNQNEYSALCNETYEIIKKNYDLNETIGKSLITRLESLDLHKPSIFVHIWNIVLIEVKKVYHCLKGVN